MITINSNKQSGTITTRVVCAICFVLFSFSWLYFLQGDVLAVAQHILSEGVTHYDSLIGAITITITLFLIQIVVMMAVKFEKETFALSYLPSLLLLALLSDITPAIYDKSVIVFWLIVGSLTVILWIGIIWLTRQVLTFNNNKDLNTGLFSRQTWVNLLQMIIMMFGVGVSGHTTAVEHYGDYAESALMRNDYDDALKVGKKSLDTDERLTMLRAFALSKQQRLGDELFTYALKGTGETLLPQKVKPLLMNADSIWKHLGARPASPMSSYRYFQLLDSLATPAVADYRLCSYLIDRKINDFVRLLPKYYNLTDSLPLHYREALVIYESIRNGESQKSVSDTIVFQEDTLLEQKWIQFCQLEKDYPLFTERHFHAYDTFRNTYWYYYYYCK